MASNLYEAIREALTALGGIRTKAEISDWVEQHYPKRWKPAAKAGYLYGCSINNPKGVQHHPNSPRFLFAHGNGQYELYDAGRHGTYENGLPAGELGGVSEAEVIESNGDAASTAFAYEEHLRDYLAKHLHILESGLTLWTGSEPESVEYSVEGRRIDILAKDKSNVPVVVELKVSRGHEKTIGQCLYYRAKIKELMKTDRVRIFIVAEEISPELKLAAKEVSDVTLFEYSLSMTVRPIS